jgi:hypothetical protein
VATNADPSLLKALGRAFRWKRMLEDGTVASVSDIARVEKIDRGYAGSVLRLTLLAPETVEAILEGRQPEGMTLPVLLKAWPLDWGRQPLVTDPSSDWCSRPTMHVKMSMRDSANSKRMLGCAGYKKRLHPS